MLPSRARTLCQTTAVPLCGKRAFACTPAQDLETVYGRRVHASYQEYADRWGYKASFMATNQINDYVLEHYVKPNKIGRQNYMEIGIGEGYGVDQFVPYFNNAILVEPNSVYRETVNQRLVERNIKHYRFVPDIIDRFDEYLDAETEANNLNLINISHVMYHIYPEHYEAVMSKICAHIAPNKEGIAVISMLMDDESKCPFYAAHLKFADKVGALNSDRKLEWTINTLRYLDMMANDHIEYEIVDDEFVFDMDVDTAANMLAFWIPSHLIAYSGNDYDEKSKLFDEQEMKDNAINVLKEFSVFTGNKNEDGIDLVSVPFGQRHIIISKI